MEVSVPKIIIVGSQVDDCKEDRGGNSADDNNPCESFVGIGSRKVVAEDRLVHSLTYEF